MNDFEYIDEPEGPSIGFPFNVPDEFLEFLDAEDKDEEEEDNLTVVKRRILKFMEVAA